MKFIKECIWKIIPEWMYKHWSPTALDLPLIPVSRLCSVAWLEQNHPALPSPRNPRVKSPSPRRWVWSRAAATAPLETWRLSRDLRPSPGGIHSCLPHCAELVHVLSQGCATAECMWWEKPGRDDPPPSRAPWSHSLHVSCHPNGVKLISFLLESSFSFNVWVESIFFLLL